MVINVIRDNKPDKSFDREKNYTIAIGIYTFGLLLISILPYIVDQVYNSHLFR